MKEIKYKYFAWSYDKAYLDKIMDNIVEKGIPCLCDNNLERYLLSTSQDYYRTALDIICEIGDENRMGSINYYDQLRPLKAYPLVHTHVEDSKTLNKSWEDEISRPKKIKQLIKRLRKICGCDVGLIVNTDDSSVDIFTTRKIDNIAIVKDRVLSFLEDNNYVKFKESRSCSREGYFFDKTSTEKAEGIFRLADSSFLSCGMYRPDDISLVSINPEKKDNFSIHFTDDLRFLEEDREDKIVILGKTRLIESKRYNFCGEEIDYLQPYKYCKTYREAIRNYQEVLLSLETCLDDKISYEFTMILSDDMVAKITTKFKDSREVSSNRKLPLGIKYPDYKSVRDDILPFPKESGEYEGVIQEYYMRSTNGTKLLHYATHSPYFEIYDIPADFDFIYNNEALEKLPSVYDIREYNPEEPEIASVKDLIDEVVRKLELVN